MKHTIELRKGALSAVALFAAKKDARYYRHGVFIETGPKGAILVATDGYALAAMHAPADCEVSAGVVPIELISNAIKTSKGDKLYLTIDTDHPTATGQPMYTIAGMHAQGIDGRFPEWRRVVPTCEPSCVAAQFDPELVSRFGKAAKLLGKKSTSVCVAHNGPEQAARVLIDSSPDFLGVIMPYWRKANTDVPDWF